MHDICRGRYSKRHENEIINCLPFKTTVQLVIFMHKHRTLTCIADICVGLHVSLRYAAREHNAFSFIYKCVEGEVRRSCAGFHTHTAYTSLLFAPYNHPQAADVCVCVCHSVTQYLSCIDNCKSVHVWVGIWPRVSVVSAINDEKNSSWILRTIYNTSKKVLSSRKAQWWWLGGIAEHS